MSILIKPRTVSKHSDTQGKRPREEEDRDWSYAVTSQEHQEPTEGAGGREGFSPLELMEEAQPSQYLYLGFLAS